MNLEPEQFRDLARVLLKTRPVEVTCDEWLDRVGQYAELVLAGRPIPESLKAIVDHIDLCPECAEEFRAILAAIGHGE